MIAINIGIPSQPSLSTVKMEGTPFSVVKMEASPHPINPGNRRRPELDPPYGQVVTSDDDADSDTASEVDDKYSHAKVCDGL